MLQITAYNTYNLDILCISLNLRNQTADTSDDHLYLYSCLRCFHQFIDDHLICQGIDLDSNISFISLFHLVDFFLYHILRFGRHPAKVYRLALKAFEGVYDAATILRWLKTFYRRFFAQQFKRSCLPDGPKVGSVAVSPRVDLRMPSDACVTLWMQELDEIVE